ncbi:hypothetical protein QFZ75_006962 [Streptomyces sp. V3I8]|nr:hypothetical protein [Streptomyces sp. V3I8]
MPGRTLLSWMVAAVGHVRDHVEAVRDAGLGQAALRIAVVVLHHDLTQGLNAEATRAVRSVPIEVFQEPEGIVPIKR